MPMTCKKGKKEKAEGPIKRAKRVKRKKVE
jgi:hypothetical protein